MGWLKSSADDGSNVAPEPDCARELFLFDHNTVASSMTLIRQSNVDICALNEAQLSRAVDYSSRAALFHIFRVLKIAPTSEVPGKKKRTKRGLLWAVPSDLRLAVCQAE